MKSLNIIVCMDSFKGSLTAREAGEAVAKGLNKCYPNANITIIPLGDGGEGTIDIIEGSNVSMSAGESNDFSMGRDWERHYIDCHDPLMRKIRTYYLYSPEEKSAYIESAKAVGLDLLSASERTPMNTTSYGLGEMILDAVSKEAEKITIGLGGSSVNDCGIGMLSALGWRFYDENSQIDAIHGKDLPKIKNVVKPSGNLIPESVKIKILTDVTNPLFGPTGSASVYGPQKGATAEEVGFLDEGLKSFSQIVETVGIDRKEGARKAGAGSAGGLGYALNVFLEGEYTPGIKAVLEMVGFSNLISTADLIITGEGCSDRQSLMGKVIGGVLEAANEEGVPVVVISGKVNDYSLLKSAGFRDLFAVEDKCKTLEENMEKATAIKNIENCSSRLKILLENR